MGPLNWYTVSHHGFSLCGDTWMVLAGTSLRETLGYVSEALNVWVVLAVIGLLAYVVLMIRFVWLATACRFCGWCRMAGLVLVVAVCACLGGQFRSAISYGFVHEGFKTAALYMNMAETAENPSLPDNLSLVCPNAVGFFVIGESASRNSWSLYGYKRPTTSALDAIADELYVFRDVVAPWASTHAALRLVMSEADLDNPEGLARCFLPQICAKAGYRCVFITAQEHWGGVDISGDYLFSACEEKIRLSKMFSRPYYDLDLSVAVSNVLENVNGPTLIFAHTYGNHFPCSDRYPHEQAFFGREGSRTRIDEYDNATRCTTTAIRRMIDALKASGRPSFCFYLSDHGETPRSDSWRNQHDSHCWEIPMFFWMSEAFAASYPQLKEELPRSLEKPLQADQLLAGLTELFGVRGYCSGSSFLRDDFHPRRPRRINNNGKAYEKDL